ncbi:histidine kinase [Geobacter sp.]|uniref:histidine kinase n=1 Tax=Geobacter sp. TaxID=46610 RepID=UPI0027B8E779|nr:histidine kinase [Geobacter sp.]
MKKKLLVATAACALSAATAVPALALENEFHGMFRVFGYVNNFGTGTGGQIIPVDNASTRSYVEQRARLMYIAKANDDLKLVTHFEIDSRWGDSAYGTGRNSGGGLGADQTNLETKNVYLDFNIPSTAINAKVGVQPWIDSYGGILVNADMAGALVSAKYAGFTNSLGWFRFNDSGTLPGKATRDFLNLDSKYNLTKDIKVGGSYYLLTDDRAADNTYTHMVGLNGEFNLAPVTLGVFGMYQFGDTPGTGTDLSAFAAGATLKAKAGIGTFKLAALYTSGDKSTGPNDDSSAFQSISSAASENSFYAADMQIMLRNKYNINSDRSIVNTFNNNNQGFIGGFVGYDANITPKFFANVNAGFAAAANNDGDNYLGTEVNAEVGYKLFDNMTASIQGAYFVLGDYYDEGATEDADDPYQARVMLNYAF